MTSSSGFRHCRGPPANYTVPPFPDLHWPPQDCVHALYTLKDSFKFTLLWTLILYACFHIGVASIALVMQIGKHPSRLKYVWIVPIVYAGIAGLEALLAGSIVGVAVGAFYRNGDYVMSTWIPFIWGWINVLVLVVSSFSIQGGL